MSNVEIKAVRSKKERNDFLLVPWDIYANDPNWIPPLLMAVEQSLDTKKNPFYRHARLEMWNAYRDGKCVGRIAGVVDDRNNQFHEEKVAFWGFFECENNPQTAAALFQVVEEWASKYGMTAIRGPMSPSTNHECGMQLDAFDTKPFIMMTQNPDYYPQLVESIGHQKAKDLFAWLLDNSEVFDERILRRARQLEKSEEIKIRTLNLKDYDREIDRVLEIYNDAWEKNWGFVPMSEAQFRHMADDMKGILIPELLFMVEVRGEPAAFSLWLPDLNQVMEKIPNGKLFPTGLLKLLWHTKVKKTVNRGRVLTLGVKQKFRNLGLAPLLYLKYYETAPKMGYPLAECSWILEDNKAMNQGLRMMRAKMYKTYRIYEKPLEPALN